MMGRRMGDDRMMGRVMEDAAGGLGGGVGCGGCMVIEVSRARCSSKDTQGRDQGGRGGEGGDGVGGGGQK